MTVQQVRVALGALLQSHPPPPKEIALLITYQLRRNDEARVHRYKVLGLMPPPRKVPS